MGYSPTIVAASLSDKDLKDSIDKLVRHVEEGTQKMVKSMDNAVEKMKKSLQSLGDVNINSSGASDGGASRRAKAQNEETKAIEQNIAKRKEQKVTLDQTAETLQKVASPKSAQESYHAMFSGFREQAKSLQQLISQWESLQLARRIGDVNAIGSSIEQTTQKINALKGEITNLRKEQPTGYRNQIKEREEQIEQLKQKIIQFREEQKRLTDAPIQDNEYLKRYRAQLQGVLEILNTQFDTQTKFTREQFKTAEASKKQTDELSRQLELINGIKSRKEATKAFEAISLMPQGTMEEMQAKISSLRALMEKTANTPLISKSNQRMAVEMINVLTQKYNYQKDAKERAARGSSVSKDDIEAIRKASEAEKKWTENIHARGIEAQETSRKLLRLLHEESAKGGIGAMGLYVVDGKQINAVKELDKAVKDMQASYGKMTNEEKMSPIGMALAKDIEVANEARRVVSAYNALAIGAVRGTNSERGDKLLQREMSSLSALSRKVSELSQQYQGLTMAEIKAGAGDKIIKHYQEVSREVQKAKAALNTPVSLQSALGIPTKTLDDMTYKIRMLQAYKNSIELTKPNAANEISQVDKAIANLQRELDKYMAKTKSVEKSNTALLRSWNYMKNRLAFYFTVGASTQFVKNLIEVRSQYEMNERALGILINSAERGTQIFQELSNMALVSPYTLIELSSAAKQLTAYDIAAKDVVDTTRRLADMTSAVGIPIERLTYALGQVKAYGYLNSRDARMFANAGIPLVKELSDYYTKLEGRIVSVSDVYDKIKKKAISYNDVMSVVTKMTDEGGKFFDFQAKMAGTLKVQLANLTLAWNNMLNDIGSDTQGMLAGGIAGLKELFLHWKDIDKVIKTVVVAFGLWKAAQLTALAFTGQLTGAMAAQVVVGQKLQTRIAALATGFKSASIGISAAGAAFWLILADGIMTYIRNVEEIEQLNKNIADGARESAESLLKFMQSTEIAQNRLAASTGKLPKSDAEKTWNSLREQIELSSATADVIIPKLIKIEDLNQRLTVAFSLADSIAKANEKLGDLYDKLDITQDSILAGIFGEGVVEDIEDYNEHLKTTAEISEYTSKKNTGFIENSVIAFKSLFDSLREDLGSSEAEAEEEIRKFAHNAADTIREELGEEGLSDRIQVGEAVARIMKGVEMQFPKIRGKGKILFETLFYNVMSNEFKGAVDEQAYYYRMFLERLKKDHGSAFQGVTEGIKKETYKWSQTQLDAIDKTSEKVKEDLPYAAHEAIDSILKELNSTEFKIRIATEFATSSIDSLNEAIKDRYIRKPWIADQKERDKEEAEANSKYSTLLRKEGESTAEYNERITKSKKEQLAIEKTTQDIIDKNKGKTDAIAVASTKAAKEENEAAKNWLSAAKEIEKSGGFDFTTKEESRNAKNAQKQAESELQKALKEEIALLDKTRSVYKSLTKEGVSSTEAIDIATQGYGKTLTWINSVLNKYGIETLDLAKYAGIQNPAAVMQMLQNQLERLINSGLVKPEEIKDLEVKLKDLKVDSVTFDHKTVTESLNNELSKLKDEYELSVELDANPELGDMFANMMGLSADDLAELPKDFEGVVRKMQAIVDDKLGQGAFDVSKNLNKKAFDEYIKNAGVNIDSDRAKQLKSIVDFANEVQQKETKKQIDEWKKLLEKYAEYEYKKNLIAETAQKERATARKKGASIDVFDAIDIRERQEAAKLDFEYFQKTPEWIAATGNLATLSHKTISVLIEDLEEYRRKSKNLDPKQIKQINKALSNLYKEQRKNNPFKAISNMLQQSREDFMNYQSEIDEVEKEMNELYKRQGTANWNDAQAKKLDDLLKKWKKLKELQEGGLDATTIVSAVNETVTAVRSAVAVFDDLAKAIGGVNNSDIDKVFSVFEKAGQGAAIGAQFGGVGAAIGASVGAATGLISAFADKWSGNESITESIEESNRAIKNLENSYLSLQQAIERAYGSNEIGAKRAAAAAKELQLAELKRQLTLEQSRSSKNRDKDRILDLKKQIKELTYEIQNATRELVDDLLGTDVGGFAENLVSSMITAFKNGEDYMKTFSESFDTMVDNMIMKSIVGRVVSNYLDSVWENVEQRIAGRTKEEADAWAEAQAKADRIAQMSDDEVRLANGQGIFLAKMSHEEIEAYKRNAAEAAKIAKAQYDAVAQIDDSDIEYVLAQLAETTPELGERLKEILGKYYKFGESSDKQLSSLQQGISGITENTAGALESYMNGVSQQVYLQSEYLRQIAVALTSGDDIGEDAKITSLSQILLQLRSSYEIQASINTMLEDIHDSGNRAFRVITI